MMQAAVKKKMLLISNMYPSKIYPEYGVFVRNIEKLMRSRGHVVKKKIVITKNRSKISKVFAYLVFYVKSFLYSLFGNYDYIYIHYSSLSSPGIILASYFKAITVVVNAHGGDCIKQPGVSIFMWQLRKMLSAWIFRRAKIIVVPSRYLGREIVTGYNVNEGDVIVSPSGGVNTKLFDINRVITARAEKYTFGYVGRLVQGKGIATLILAYRDLPIKLRETNLLYIIGGGDRECMLKNLVQKHKLEKYIVFAGRAAQKNLPELITKFHCLVFPTECESLGLVGLEAMAMRRNIIGAKTGGLPGYIEDNFNGVLFEAGNQLDLTEKLNQYICWPQEKRNKLSIEAYKTALQYDSEIIATVFCKILERKLFEVEKQMQA